MGGGKGTSNRIDRGSAMLQNPREFYLGKHGGRKAPHDFFLQCSGSFNSYILEAFPLSVVKLYTTFSFSLPLIVSYIYI